MTGADFNYVLASAQGAESHFRWLKHLFLSYLLTTLPFWVVFTGDPFSVLPCRLKAEKEWEKAAESLGELSQVL